MRAGGVAPLARLACAGIAAIAAIERHRGKISGGGHTHWAEGGKEGEEGAEEVEGQEGEEREEGEQGEEDEIADDAAEVGAAAQAIERAVHALSMLAASAVGVDGEDDAWDTGGVAGEKCSGRRGVLSSSTDDRETMALAALQETERLYCIVAAATMPLVLAAGTAAAAWDAEEAASGVPGRTHRDVMTSAVAAEAFDAAAKGKGRGGGGSQILLHPDCTDKLRDAVLGLARLAASHVPLRTAPVSHSSPPSHSPYRLSDLTASATSAGEGGGGTAGAGRAVSDDTDVEEKITAPKATTTSWEEIARDVRPLPWASAPTHDLGTPRASTASSSHFTLAVLADGGRRFDTRLGALAARVASLAAVLEVNTAPSRRAADRSKHRGDTSRGGSGGRGNRPAPSLGESARWGLERRTAAVVSTRVRSVAGVLRAAAAADDFETASERAATELDALRRQLAAHQASGELALLRARLGRLRLRRAAAVTAAAKDLQPAAATLPRLLAAAEAWRGVSASLSDEEAPKAALQLMEAVANIMEALYVADEIQAFAAEAGEQLRAAARMWDEGAGTVAAKETIRAVVSAAVTAGPTAAAAAAINGDVVDAAAAATVGTATSTSGGTSTAAAGVESGAEAATTAGSHVTAQAPAAVAAATNAMADPHWSADASSARRSQSEAAAPPPLAREAAHEVARIAQLQWLLRAAATLRPHVGGDLERDLVDLHPSLLAVDPAATELKFRAQCLRRLRDRVRKAHTSAGAADAASRDAQAKVGRATKPDLRMERRTHQALKPLTP